MEYIERPNETLHGPLPTSEWAKLIRKLRWIGLEDEARRLETAASTLPPEERGSVSAGPFSTD
ncbi:MAG: hypothetical protein IT537_10980 [Hyphomicrobiales bacterium]|nr:hypothetical protein [Hyphomicrobiales bacterium]